MEINNKIGNEVSRENPSFSTLDNYELDFLIRCWDNKTYGIEIKYNNGETKSLNYYLEKKLLDTALVIKNSTGGIKDNKVTIPNFYLAIFLENIKKADKEPFLNFADIMKSINK